MDAEINTSLSQSQAKFALMLERAPYLKPLWDLEKREYIPQLIDSYLATASHGEIIMAKFFLGVWMGKDDFDFDLFDAASTLDSERRKIIVDWFQNPFWP